MSTPLISVITPVYKTPLSLFEEAFHSLEAQTCGFEKIEWLVAIHNMDDTYAESLKKITGEHENIVFLRVNRGNAPSVPRNCCLEHASGKYLFFLDSDDVMAPDCIEKATNAMDSTNADIAVFSCEYFIENNNLQKRQKYIVNAPDRELIVYEHGDPRISSLRADFGAMLWCRVYRRAFIERYSFRFDENIRIGEDVFFNYSVDSLAELICVLPHLIGYYHREWNGSIIQSEIYQDNKEEEILRYLPTIQTHDSVEMILFQLSNYAMRYIKRKMEKAQQLRERNMIAPVLQQMRVMAPRFTYTRNRILGMHAIVNVFTPPTEARLRQLHVTLETPISEEEVRIRTAAATAENIELQTVSTEEPYIPFLGISRPDAQPEICILDLQKMPQEQQKSHMDSYRRIELLRGFKDGEVRCRVTLFKLSPLRCALSITWDGRFVGEQGIKRLQDRICGDMSKYAPRYSSVKEMLHHQTLMDPNKSVFRFWNVDSLTTVTRSELSEQMNALGAFLASEGFDSCRIAIAAPNSYLWNLLYLTALCEGLTTVAIDPSLSEEEIEFRLRKTCATAIFLGDNVSEPHIDGVKCYRISMMPEFLEKGRKLLQSDSRPVKEITPNQEALILFTSGTTGYGKAVVHTQGNLISSARSFSTDIEWYERGNQSLPLYHIAMHQVLLGQLYMGCEILITSSQIDEMLRDFQVFRPQVLHLVPRLLYVLQMLISNDKEKAIDCLGGALKAIFCGASSYSEEIVETFHKYGIIVVNFYGLTETIGIARSSVRKPDLTYKIYPLPETELKVDKNGEILVRSPMVFDGYLDDSEATTQVFDEEGWFHTGDLGLINPTEGVLTITGRIKNLILFSNGENVSPEELENKISLFPQVKECIVYGEPNETIAVQIFSTEEARSMEEDELNRVIQEQIDALNAVNSDYKKIEKFYIRFSPLERNNMGKLKRAPTQY